MQETDMTRSTMFTGAVCVGNYASEYVGPLINIIPMPTINKNLYDGKTLTLRIAEVSSSAGVTYVLNKYVLGNDPYKGEFMKRVAIIAVSDVVETYMTDYFTNKPLDYLTQ